MPCQPTFSYSNGSKSKTIDTIFVRRDVGYLYLRFLRKYSTASNLAAFRLFISMFIKNAHFLILVLNFLFA